MPTMFSLVGISGSGLIGIAQLLFFFF